MSSINQFENNLPDVLGALKFLLSTVEDARIMENSLVTLVKIAKEVLFVVSKNMHFLAFFCRV